MGLLKKAGNVFGGAFGLQKGGLVGMAIGSQAGNFLSGSGMPEQRIVELDPETKALQERMIARAERSPDEIAREELEGTEKSGLLKSSLQDQEHQSKALGYNEEMAAMQKRIQDRAQKDYSEATNQLQRKVRLQAPVRRFQAMAMGDEINRKASEIDMKNAEIRLNNAMGRHNARTQAIGAIIGLGATVGGGVAGRNAKTS